MTSTLAIVARAARNSNSTKSSVVGYSQSSSISNVRRSQAWRREFYYYYCIIMKIIILYNHVHRHANSKRLAPASNPTAVTPTPNANALFCQLPPSVHS
jgi:hypothetical protein